jgi:hypothetical protein
MLRRFTGGVAFVGSVACAPRRFRVNATFESAAVWATSSAGTHGSLVDTLRLLGRPRAGFRLRVRSTHPRGGDAERKKEGAAFLKLRWRAPGSAAYARWPEAKA